MTGDHPGMTPEREMRKQTQAKAAPEMLERLQALSRGKKIVLGVFVVWALQAVPKWTAAIVADGETSAAIMSYFVEPRWKTPL